MLSIALPKGSLEEQTLMLFTQADISVKKGPRQYNPIIDDPRIDKIKILRPQEIPKYVEEGYFDLGISGKDCIVESGADVVEVADMPYAKTGTGKMRMVIAVPDNSSIEKPEDILIGSRITTEFPNITKNYFDKLGIPVKVYYSYGATEAKIPEIMDIVVDLTETGETLRRNQLKIIGIIMESTTRLIANKVSIEDKEKRKAMEEIKTLLLGVLEARGRVLLSMNVSKDKLENIIKTLPAMKRPTVNQLYNSDYLEVTTVVDKANVNIIIPKLKAQGAEDILEMDIAKIVR
ncbi:MAG TPA: ATP phosphoribosyltransferase [Thermoplasmata archaeon]|nr:ATP phosphoribosyltransferase [Thermoplasmata archaeon]